MKRLFLIFVLIIILAGVISIPALAQTQQEQQIPVLIDGLPVIFDVHPVIENGRTLVPFRAIAEALNVEVSWDNSTQIINATNGKTTVRLQIGNKTVYHNNSPILLNIAPVIKGGRTLIPLRFFSEAFSCKVKWDDTIGGVLITSSPKEMKVVGFYALGDRNSSSWTDLFNMPYPQLAIGNSDIVDEVALGWYSLDEMGNLVTKSRTGWQRPDGWENVLEAADKYQLKTEMVIHVTDAGSLISSLFTNEIAMNKAINDILNEVKLYEGINLNFEGLGYRDEGEKLKSIRNNFTMFVKLLAQHLHAADKSLTLTLHAPNSAYPGYDYQVLGKLADKIIIMAYEYGSAPEPVNLVTQAVEMAIAVVPPQKLLLGISVPKENSKSILIKAGIAKKYNLAGIALWRLGVMTDEMWAGLRTTIKPRQIK